MRTFALLHNTPTKKTINMTNKQITLGIIAGPTGIGKTYYGIQLARRIDAEIISADSMQVYKYLNIGTAKPTLEERIAVPHHLIDILYPDERFDVAQFIKLATNVLYDIFNRGKFPLLIGGTGLYIKGLIKGIFEQPSYNSELRDALEDEANTKGLSVLYERLKFIDPRAANFISPNDRIRIIRALEVFMTIKRPISELQEESQKYKPPFDYKIAALTMKRKILYERIEKRIDAMFESGFIDEVKSILEMGYSPTLHSLNALGYHQVIEYLEGKKTLDEAIDEMKKLSRNYAKRQLTWFRGMKDVHWLDITGIEEQEVVESLEKIICS